MRSLRDTLNHVGRALVRDLPIGEPTSRTAWKRAWKRLRARHARKPFAAIALVPRGNSKTRAVRHGVFAVDEGGRIELVPSSFDAAGGRDVVLHLRFGGARAEFGLHFDFGPGLTPLPGFPAVLTPGDNAIAFRMPVGVRQLVLEPNASTEIAIDAARLVPADAPRKRRPVEAALAMLEHGGGLVPAAELAFDLTERTFRTTGYDPQLRLAAPPLHAGFYMLEVAEQFERPRCVARLYARFGREQRDEDSFALPLRPGQLTKRIVRLRDRPKAMRFDPVEHATPLLIDAFELVPLPERFALDRMLQKLGRGDVARARREVDDEARATGRRPIDVAFARYDAIFQTRANVTIRYEDWIESVEAIARPDPVALLERLGRERALPTISVVVPVYDPDEAHLRACLESVFAQRYPHWELCVADDASRSPRVRAVLEEFAARDPRMKLVFRAENGRIAAASNSALALATGAFVALLDHDDTLDPDALLLVAGAIADAPDAAIVYSDEDKLDRDGKRWEPHFKPDWNRDLLYGLNYVSHLGVYCRALVAEVGGFREGFDGSQDYDLLLRCIERIAPSQIVHLPYVLYHWRMAETSVAAGDAAKDYTTAASLRALASHFERTSAKVTLSSHRPNFFRVHWPLPDEPPLVTIVVPTRDGGAVLERAIGSILAKTTYPRFELLIVDNESRDPGTLAYLRELATRPDVDVFRYEDVFNFSAINNAAVARARGSVIALVNDDVEVISPGWLDEMVSLAVRERTGCVGAKLYYPNDTIQHAGVIVGLGGIAGHSHKYAPRSSPGYFGRLLLTQELSAVTGACLVVRKRIWDEVSGLDAERLAVAFNDVDFCLRVREAGYVNVFTPFAELYHHESASRGRDDVPEKRARFARESEAMRSRWREALDDDPAYSPNLTQDREDFTITSRVRSLRTRGG